MSESADTGELMILLTSQNHSTMDLPSYIVHHLSADNFQSVLRELSFIEQFVQPMNSLLVLFNFKLKKRSEPLNFNHKTVGKRRKQSTAKNEEENTVASVKKTDISIQDCKKSDARHPK